MKAKQFLVLGSTGQLGMSLLSLSRDSKDIWHFANRSELDLSQDYFEQKLRNLSFDVLINCAAYTSVDKAESDIALCQSINHLAVEAMARICVEKNAILFHISSDYVYHNSLNRPLKETDPTQPKGVYALSKWEGEQAIVHQGAKACIIRTSWVYSYQGQNFVKTMLSLANHPKSIKVVDDQIGTPTSSLDLARAVLSLLGNTLFLKKIKEEKAPIFLNFSNEGVASWYDFAKAIFEESKIEVECLPIPTTAYPTPAPRPAYSVMDKKKIKPLLPYPIPHWREALREIVREISKETSNR